ncbi:hypothetical protein [uncultured Novosphingobium sp.]|nr:hypothetical protein [uncultured Novosphingobium sp.]
MMRRSAITIAMAGTIAAAALLLPGCKQADQPKPEAKPENDKELVHHFMEDQVQPTAMVFWNSVQFISDEKGFRQVKPQNDAEWKRVEDAMLHLQDLSATLQTPEYSAGRGEEWNGFAQAVSDVAKQAEAATKSRDTKRMFEVGGTLDNVCESCHKAYLPKSETQRPGEKS